MRVVNGWKLNYPLIYDFLNNLVPSTCLLCEQRQQATICDPCLASLGSDIVIRKCVICANPHSSWVCKRCQFAKWAFDATHALSLDSSRIVPLVKKFHLHGQFKQSRGLFVILNKYFNRIFLPVDAIIPLPEPLSVTQTRGYQSNLEIAKQLSKFKKIPLISDLLTCYPNYSGPKNPLVSPFILPPKGKSHPLIHYSNIAIVGCSMHSEYLYHHFAAGLKSMGIRRISNWIIVRVPNLK